MEGEEAQTEEVEAEKAERNGKWLLGVVRNRETSKRTTTVVGRPSEKVRRRANIMARLNSYLKETTACEG